MLDIKIEVNHTMKAFMSKVEKIEQKATEAGLFYIGGWLRQEIKTVGSFASHKAGTYVNWAPLSPYTGVLSRADAIRNKPGKRQAAGRKKGGAGFYKRRTSTRSEPLAKLVNMASFDVNKSKREVTTGFIKSTKWGTKGLQEIIKLHAEGGKSALVWGKRKPTDVTRRMQKKFFALGLPLKKSTTVLKIPARPWIEPIYKRNKHKFPSIFKKGFDRRFNEQLKAVQ